MARGKNGKDPKQVAALKHDEATRKNIPTAELQSLAERVEEMRPHPPAHFARESPLKKGETRPRDPDLDPQIVWNGIRIRLTKDQVRALENDGQIEIGNAQLVWRGKDAQDWSDLVVQVPPLYIQEKIHPKVIIDDLIRRTKKKAQAQTEVLDLFADFNGIDLEAKLEFYEHDQHWSNRMIIGDSLQVMASLAEREGLKGKVQCIYIDPPYGIKFNSNWQVSTLSRDVKDGKREDVSREPEQVKAFRDTWKDGIHSYLNYLRDRLSVAKELLAQSGSVFVQIGDENVHRVRALMDEVFGAENFVHEIAYRTSSGRQGAGLDGVIDFVLWYARDKDYYKFRPFLIERNPEQLARAFNYAQREDGTCHTLTKEEMSDWLAGRTSFDVFQPSQTQSPGVGGPETRFHVEFEGKRYPPPPNGHWRSTKAGFERLAKAKRLYDRGQTVRFRLRHKDYPFVHASNIWMDTLSTSFGDGKVYVVETNPIVIQRCVLMTTDPGDLVIDPTCGSGTTATVAERWGRRWITIDTSRVAIALARARIMGARFPFYFLADSAEGRAKEQDVSGKIQPSTVTRGDIRAGFVYDRVPHITLGAIARNTEIDSIWEEAQKMLEPLREKINETLNENWKEWEIPREASMDWSEEVRTLHKAWWDARISRQKKIDDSIGKNAEIEHIYDRPYEDKSRVRVAGPFTVESLSPHRVVPADEEELLDLGNIRNDKRTRLKFDTPPTDFAQMVLENLKTSGVQQSHKADKIIFTALTPWPGTYVNAEGQFLEGSTTRRAAIFIGPEFGTVSRIDLVAAAREATDARFDVLIACAFNFDALSSELSKLGPLPVLKAKMNPDLHMAADLKNTGKGNLFIVFGEPDIEIRHLDGGMMEIQVKGVDVFDPNTGEIRSDDPKDIAAWFIDTDYNEESFFVRHAYFLGAQDPYKSLKTTLKAEIDPEAWEALYRETSRPFPRPATGRIAVKVINHFGDEVMKVFGV